MGKQDKTIRVTYTVLLNSGKEFAHHYDIPANVEAMKKFVKKMTEMLRKSIGGQGLAGQETYPLFFGNPVAIYNPRNIEGVQFSTTTPEELEQVEEKLGRKMGFV